MILIKIIVILISLQVRAQTAASGDIAPAGAVRSDDNQMSQELDRPETNNDDKDFPEATKARQKEPVKLLVNNSKELEKRVAERIKDPFMIPNHLFLKIKIKQGNVAGEGYVDESVEPQVRWALKHYKLVAIIWNVKKPKAMITDLENKLHMFHLKDRIGNGDGVIRSIGNGEVIVDEKGTETKFKMSR